MTTQHKFSCDVSHYGPTAICNCGAERRAAKESGLPYCPVHQHYKWCEHNGGVLGPTGYEAPPNAR